MQHECDGHEWICSIHRFDFYDGNIADMERNTASFAAQSVWYHLIQDTDFNYILHKNFVFIIKRDLPINEKMNAVISYMKHYKWLFEDDSEFDIDDELVQELEEYGNT
jgi:hypothetical protein